jgi:hypothetical protein
VAIAIDPLAFASEGAFATGFEITVAVSLNSYSTSLV